MADKYNSVVKTVTAIQFTFDTLKDIYAFLDYRDCTFSIKDRKLSGIVTGTNGEKLAVQKLDFVVKDSDKNITIWKPDEFAKNYTKAN